MTFLKEQPTSPFYVYTLSYPPQLNDGTVFYVGHGAGNRMHNHHGNTESSLNKARAEAVRDIEAQGYRVIRRIEFEASSKDEARDLERMLIEAYGIENLTNVSPGSGPAPNTGGRPRLEQEPQVVRSITVPKSLWAAVTEYAYQHNASVSQVVRDALREFVERHKAEK